ncbi:hypothetical protein WMY93_026915 [Mugilogobius chulae]|uniref:Uncharacterized protein n=1 Tax=Mugilogobius chulae TaxID=88201 RepID=A0AAW0MVT8_9GOBI
MQLGEEEDNQTTKKKQQDDGDQETSDASSHSSQARSVGEAMGITTKLDAASSQSTMFCMSGPDSNIVEMGRSRRFTFS